MFYYLGFFLMFIKLDYFYISIFDFELKATEILKPFLARNMVRGERQIINS